MIDRLAVVVVVGVVVSETPQSASETPVETPSPWWSRHMTWQKPPSTTVLSPAEIGLDCSTYAVKVRDD